MNIITFLWLAIFINTAKPKIISGEQVELNKINYQVSLQMYDNVTQTAKHICSGVVLTNQTILTAAHCVSIPGFPSDPDNYIVIANTVNKVDGVKYKVVKIDIIEESGIDLVKLEVAHIDNNDFQLQPIPLRNKKTNDSELCSVSGWGYGGVDSFPSSTPSNNLMKTSVKIVEFEKCIQTYEPGTIKNGMICANDENLNTCAGDAGSPLVCDGELTGIFSFAKTCGSDGAPSVFIEVAKYVKWINGASSLKHSVISIFGIALLNVVLQYYIRS